MNTTELLESIFGDEYGNLTKREIGIAVKVAGWFDSSFVAGEKKEERLVNASRYALESEGVSWESVMHSRKRLRNLIEYRYIITSILWPKLVGSQPRKVKVLGGAYDRVTYLHAIKTTDDWLKYDKTFREKYYTILRNMEDYLSKG